MKATARVAPLFCLALILILGSACKDFAPGDTTLVYSYGGGGEIKAAVLRELAAQFEAKHPGTRIYLHALPPRTDDQRTFYLSSLSARSNFVDVFEADVIWTAEFAGAGLLLDLGRFPAFADTTRFVRPLVQQATYDGKLYAAPYYATFGALFYRADLLRKHKLKPPTTLEQLVQQAKQVGQAEGMAGLLFQADDYEGLACTFLELYACHGEPARVAGERVALDPATTRRTLRFMLDAIATHKITPASVLSHFEVDSTEAFSAGKAVFMRNWPGAYPYIRQHLDAAAIGVSVMPSSRGSLSGGFLLAVNARTEVPRLAAALAAFFASPSSQRLLARRLGQAPALRALYQGADRPPGLPAGVLGSHVIRPRSPYYFELSQVITEQTRAVLKGELSVDQGTQRMIDRTRDLKLLRKAAPGFPKSNYMTRYRP